MRKKAKITAIALQKRIFWSIAVFVLVLFTLYGYFVSKSITNVLLRAELEQNIATINTDISELEFEYLDKKNTISIQFAYAKGFKDIRDKQFVARKSFLGKRLTLSNEI
jgi:hypothetical protein